MCFSYALEWQSGQRISTTTAEPSQHDVLAYSTETISLPKNGYSRSNGMAVLSGPQNWESCPLSWCVMWHISLSVVWSSSKTCRRSSLSTYV